jgi:thioester reductase-like protein
LPEAVDCEGIAPPDGGYSRSKWVAERLLKHASAAGIAVTLHRLGEVMPGADGGAPNPRALTHLLLSAFVELGAAPDVAMVSDWSPVDWVAATIAGSVLRPETHRHTYHHVHPARVRFDEALDRSACLARPLQRLPAATWLEQLGARLRAAPTPALSMLAALLPTAAYDGAAARDALARLLTDNPRLFARDASVALTADLGLGVPALDEAIGAYARRLAAHAP